MPEICSGIGVWANGGREKEGECVHGMEADRPGGCKDIQGGDWSWGETGYVYGNYSER